LSDMLERYYKLLITLVIAQRKRVMNLVKLLKQKLDGLIKL